MRNIYPQFSSIRLTRRDFLTFLALAEGTFLFSGCANRLPAAVSIPTATGIGATATEETTEETGPVTETPTQTLTPSKTPEPPPIFLPAADGSFDSYPLPEPQFPNGMPLIQALQERRSSRDYRTDELPVDFVASLLWAGFGVNRPDGKRTAPSAYNVQDIDIYLVTAKGLFRYQAADHSLIPLLSDDQRQLTGSQDFVAAAPLNLVYVSDYSRISASEVERLDWSFAHSGCIAQNVYLACAALGLATVVRSTLDRAALSQALQLGDSQHITLVQTIGFPAG